MTEPADVDPLVEAAVAVTEDAYVPYSEYPVGAALRAADGSVYTGCNIEVANYSNSLHAEEVALAAALTDGQTAFDALAVVSGADDGVTPCGMCRQSLAEFCHDELPVVTVADGDRTVYTLGELLPAAFTGDSLDTDE